MNWMSYLEYQKVYTLILNLILLGKRSLLKGWRSRLPLPNRKKRIIGAFLTAILLVIIRFGWPFMFSGYEQPTAVKGIMDLQQWDFKLKGSVKLRGDWAFAPNEFVAPSPFQTLLTDTKFVKTPNSWNNFLDSKKNTALGYATYHLTILLPEKPANNTGNFDTYAFHVSNIRSSHTLYVNGLLLGSRGQPGKDKASYKPDNYPYIAFSNTSGNRVDVMLHVANFDHQVGGGILLPIEFGLPNQITNNKKYAEMSDTAIISLLILLAIFSGLLYSYQFKQSYLLYFTLFCLSSALFIITNSEKLLMATVHLSFNFYSVLQMLSIVGFIYFSYMFIIRMYPELSLTPVLWIMRIICGGYTCLFLFTPMPTYSILLPYLFYFLEISVVYKLIMLLKAVLIRHEEAPYLLLAGIALLCNGISNIMFVYNVILPVVPPIDLFVFALSLMFLVTHRFVDTMGQIKTLSLQRIRIETAYMQAQIKPHFLFNSLNTIGSFIETEPHRAQELLGEFSTYLRFSFDFTNLEPFVPFEREWALVEAYLKLEQARYGDILEIHVDVAQARGIRIPPLSIQPLVENAIRHGVMVLSEGGSVRIKAQVIDNEIELSVEDTGIGIPAERLVTLLSNLLSDSAEISASSIVHGIGLRNIQLRLNHIYGKGLMISSKDQQGTIVKFRVPREAAKRNDFENTFG